MTERPYGWGPGLVPASQVGLKAEDIQRGANVVDHMLTPATWSTAPYDDGTVLAVPDDGVWCRATRADGAPCGARQAKGTEYCAGHLNAIKKAMG